MNDKINRLNDLIELYKSNAITKDEYELLKKELFLDTNVRVNIDSLESKSGNKVSEINKNQNNNQKETFYNSNKRILNPILIVVCIGLFYLQLHNNKSQKSEEFNSPTVDSVSNSIESTSNICSICGKEFNNRGYEEVSEGVWKELEEGNQGLICSPACGRKHNQQFKDIAKKYGVDLEDSQTNSPNNSNYTTDKDGNLHEPNACPLCKGKGYELGRNLGNGEREMITCRICKGTGSRYN
ncbi:MAG: hypothetical protein ABI576_19670 [Flavobacterium sp.]